LFLGCSTGSGKRKEQAEERDKVILELEYGRLLANKILQKYPLYENNQINLYVNKVGKSIAMFAGRTEIEYHFAVIDGEDINAYATPGGYVFLTKGALKAMENEIQLAGVLAHEIGHINLKHIMKDIPPPRENKGVVDFLASLLVAQGAVVSSAMSQAVNKASDLLFSKGYKINDEYEADKTALIYTEETSYNPLGLIEFLENINVKDSEKEKKLIYNTHPSPRERVSRLNSFIKAEKFNISKPRDENRFLAEMKNLK